MHCDDVIGQLDEALDSDPRGARLAVCEAELESHLRDCESCRGYLQAMRWTLGQLEALQASVPVALKERVLHELATTPAGRAERLSSHISLAAAGAVLTAIAATVLIAVMNWYPTNDPLVPQLAIVEAGTPGAAPQSAEPIGALARAATDRYLNVARESSAGLADCAVLLPGWSRADSGAIAVESPAAVEMAATDSWMHEVSDGLEPVARTTLGAMSSLWGAVAELDEGPRS